MEQRDTRLTVSNNFTIDVQSYAQEMYTSLIQRAVAAGGNGRESLNNTQIELEGIYFLNLSNRYVEDTKDFQLFRDATQFVNATSRNPVVLVHFLYPELTMYSNFTLTNQDGENICNGQIVTIVTNYTFQYELYTTIRKDGVLDSYFDQISVQNTGSLTQNVVVEEGEVDEDINESILAAVSNDYSTNVAVDIEHGITYFAEFAYQDVDLTDLSDVTPTTRLGVTYPSLLCARLSPGDAGETLNSTLHLDPHSVTSSYCDDGICVATITLNNQRLKTSRMDYSFSATSLSTNESSNGNVSVITVDPSFEMLLPNSCLVVRLTRKRRSQGIWTKSQPSLNAAEMSYRLTFAELTSTCDKDYTVGSLNAESGVCWY
uniref:Uncharacterized protein n=1 Tax=Timema poppense TaxID=170557 RepID=A0A7R9CLH9_TIMPO|nr:unnamed protein product [Timema poppensis]